MVDNSKKYEELRLKYQNISFDKYEINDDMDKLDFVFSYTIDGLSDFKTSWSINKINKNINYDKNILDKLVFSLGLVELISYWKIVCPKNININCGYLDNNEIKWWEKLYIRGLSEYFYVNNIKVNNDTLHIISNNKSKNINIKSEDYGKCDNVLIPIGGGKDSAVTLELLKNNIDRYAYIINSRKATDDTFEKSDIDKNKLISAKRIYDKKIVEYNKKGYLNGHTPFSAIVAFSSNISAYINGISYIALSNESSANESTVRNLDVNHQYSKSFEFECDFRNYEKEYIKSGVEYFSFLRPLSEAGIAKIFSKYDKYIDIFRSCNAGSKEDIWCANCAKCLFVFIIMSPYIDKSRLIKIFGKNMLDDMGLKLIFDKLIGIEEEKPFECVGSRDEVNASLIYIIKNNINDGTLIKYYKTLNMPNNNDLELIANSYDDKNNLPDRFIPYIKEAIK